MKFAKFDRTEPPPQRVIGWYDCDLFNYPNQPDAENRLELTNEQWENRFNTPFVLNGALVTTPETSDEDILNARKAVKIAEISAAFKAELAAGVITSSGFKMNYDMADIQRLQTALDFTRLNNKTELPVLVDYDNVVHENSPVKEVQQLINEMALHYEIIFIKKNTLRSRVMAATTQADVDEINWY